MGIAEVSRLANTRGCILRVMDCDGVLLYWVENAIFVSKPFDRLEDVVDLLLRLPTCIQDTVAVPGAGMLENTFCGALLLVA